MLEMQQVQGRGDASNIVVLLDSRIEAEIVLLASNLLLVQALLLLV